MEKIFENNKKWVANKLAEDGDFFTKLANGQKPRYLYIGCSDSRVPVNEITGTGPGEIFVHRNIANMVVHSDINMLSVLQYAVDQVQHFIRRERLREHRSGRVAPLAARDRAVAAHQQHRRHRPPAAGASRRSTAAAVGRGETWQRPAFG